MAATTDSNGNIQQRLSYSTFGEPASGNPNAGAVPYQYAGREPGDPGGATGLYYNRERYYAPELGRFLSADPLGMAGGGVNLYAYCGNDPVNFRDPYGLAPWLIFTVDGTATGLKSGLAAVGHSLSFGLYSGGAYRCQPGFSTASTMANVGRDSLITAGTLGMGSGFAVAGEAAEVTEGGEVAEEAVQNSEEMARLCEGGGCFVAGTLIATPEGERPIEQVKEGDHVLSADPVTKRHSFQKVEHAYSRRVDELYTIKTEDGRTIETTAEHPFWVEGKGFVFAKKLARSDLLEDESGNLLKVAAVTSRRGVFTVYNLSVERTHTYYAGGVWVHNAGSCPFVSKDPGVGELANAIEERYPGHVVGANQWFGDVEVDVVTENANIEVKAGNGKGLTAQVVERLGLGKPVFGYALNMGPHAAAGVNAAGGIAAGGAASDLETLLEVLAP